MKLKLKKEYINCKITRLHPDVGIIVLNPNEIEKNYPFYLKNGFEDVFEEEKLDLIVEKVDKKSVKADKKTGKIDNNAGFYMENKEN